MNVLWDIILLIDKAQYYGIIVDKGTNAENNYFLKISFSIILNNSKSEKL